MEKRHDILRKASPRREETDGYVIRLQCIYNFSLFHASILSILNVLYALICYFISFFGTNLLTQCPVPVAGFLLVFYIAGNQYQTESKHCETFWRFFWTRRHLVGHRSTRGVPRGGHNPPSQARPGGLFSPRPTSGAHLLVYKSF